MRRPAPRAEIALVDRRVQRGEEQVLEHGLVVVRPLGVVVRQRPAGEAVVEQPAGNQSFLLQEPDEQQPRDQADHVAFGGAAAGAVVREHAFAGGAFEPLEQVAVEAAVQRFDVEHALPRGVQVVESADTVADEARQRQFAQDVEVRPVGARGPDVLDQRDALQHVVRVVPLVCAAVRGGDRQGFAVPEQQYDRHGQAAVDGARHRRQRGAGVRAIFQIRRHEQERLHAAAVECAIEQPGLAGDLRAGELEDDVRRTPRREHPALLVRQRLGSAQPVHEFLDAAHVLCQFAAVAERAQ